MTPSQDEIHLTIPAAALANAAQHPTPSEIRFSQMMWGGELVWILQVHIGAYSWCYPITDETIRGERKGV